MSDIRESELIGSILDGGGEIPLTRASAAPTQLYYTRSTPWGTPANTTSTTWTPPSVTPMDMIQESQKQTESVSSMFRLFSSPLTRSASSSSLSSMASAVSAKEFLPAFQSLSVSSAAKDTSSKDSNNTDTTCNNEWNSQPKSSTTLLAELRGNKTAATVQLDDVIKQKLVGEFAVDQNGSRFIQQSLEQATRDQKNAVFDQLQKSVLSLCNDVFGNYVIQKLFEYGLPHHVTSLCGTLKNHVLELSLQMYGCRVVQKAIESVSLDCQRVLVQELQGHVMQCVRDQNGNHVIQKCIEKVADTEFIVQAFIGHVYSLSTHAYGCRVIQRLLEHCEERQKNPIFEEILFQILNLVTDQYGNYVIQHVLQKGAPQYRAAIVTHISGHVLELSRHKFASNVIEKCFAYAGHVERARLVDEIIGNDRLSPVAEMVSDQYANYVVQKVLGVVNEDQLHRIIDTISLRVPNLRKITYGKHIVSRVEKLTGRCL